MEADFKKLNKTVGWAIFGLAFLAYAVTAQRSVMFWDSGEFIASTFKLQATHPPGAPLYSMLSRLFIMFFPAEAVAFGCSLFSALCGAATIWFLYQAILWLGQKLVNRTEMEEEQANWAVLAAAVVGSLALTFSDSFWVSSTEAEVYTLSTLFMAAAFWAITKWEEQGSDNRWLVLIAYILGLSVGVHVLNMAILFPLVMIVVFKYYSINWKSIGIGLGAALGLFIFINNGLIQGLLKLMIKFEIMGANSWGMDQHSGMLLFIGLFAAVLAFGIFVARGMKKKLVEMALVAIAVFSIGWSSYAMIMIRSYQATPTSNNASDPLRLMDYLRSDQFGFSDRPVLYGQTFNSVLDADEPFVDRPPVLVYDKSKGQYIVSNDGKKRKANYDDATMMVFSRMYNPSPLNVQGYRQWVNYRGRNKTVKTANGETTVNVPTYGDNLGFFFTYQLGWLNIRYFLWNFVGRQNDIKGVGVPSGGNWMSGIPYLDKGRVGYPAEMPEYYKDIASRNEYYFLPLLLGLIGIAFLYVVGKKELVVVALFFLAFGVAITTFINQLPIHILVRERDYIFLGAYYAFCIWIGIGVIGLFYWIPDMLPSRQKAMAIGGGCLLLVPGLMAFKGWDDHSRGHDHEPRNMAYNMLNQCEENGILIVSGDNITFPLWYIQEVEGHRTDVRVIDYNLLGLEWYIDKVQTKINESPAIKMSLPKEFYQHGRTSVFPLRKAEGVNVFAPVGEILHFLQNKPVGRHLPVDRFSIPVDTALMKSRMDPAGFDAVLVPQVNWQLTKQQYSMQDMVLMDILLQNNFERPVYFSNTGGNDFHMGLENYFLNKGLVNQFLPIAPKPGKHWSKLVDIAAMDSLIMNEEGLSFETFSDTTQFVSAINVDFGRNVYLPIFHNLAFAYGEKGQFDKCLKVLDRAQEMLPNKNVPYKENMMKLAISYANAGDKEEFKKVARIVMGNIIDEMSWYVSFDPKHDLITYAAASHLGNQLASLMTDIGKLDADIVREIEPQLNELQARYGDWVNNNPTLSSKLNAN